MTKLTFLPLLVLACQVTAQNVGVGTSSPLEKLHVNGNVRADSLKANALKLPLNAATGKVMTSDASGNANWQNLTAAANGSVGFGGWGDCSVQNISGFNPAVADDGAGSDYFGRSVAISGNFAIIGAPYDDLVFSPNRGSAYIFFYNGSTWVQQQKLLAGDGASDDQFGMAVSMSGNYAVVGAPGDDNGANTDQGSAYIFFYDGSSWMQTQKIEHVSSGAGDQFGNSVCIKDNKVIIGAPFDDIAGNNSQGSADIYAYNGASWVLQDRLVASDGAVDDRFGYSVTITGNYAIAGIPYDNVGSNADQGSANQYFFNGSNWVFQKKFTNTFFTATPDDRFGWSVSMSASYCIIGEPYSGIDDKTGAALIYRFNTAEWIFHQYISPPEPLGGNGFIHTGTSVSMTDDYCMVVASSWSENVSNGEGKVFIYKNYSELWQLYEDFVDPSRGRNEGFNMNSALDNNRFVVGVPQAPLNISRGKVIFGKIE